MAINLKALASWGLLAEAGGGSTQVINEMQVTVSDAVPLAVELEAASGFAPLAVELEAAEISVALSDEQ
jgi:hypothetical protein